MIDYLSAANGKLRLTNDFRGSNETFEAATPSEAAKILKKMGYGESFATSSSMDFASEDGFATDDGAEQLLNEAIELINEEKNI